MLQLTIVSNAESSGRCRSHVALELSRWWRQDAATALGIGDGAVVEAVRASRVASTHSVLSIRELSDLSLGTTRGGQPKSTLLPWKNSRRSACGETSCANERFHDE